MREEQYYKKTNAENLAFLVNCGVLNLYKALEIAKESNCLEELRYELHLKGDSDA